MDVLNFVVNSIENVSVEVRKRRKRKNRAPLSCASLRASAAANLRFARASQGAVNEEAARLLQDDPAAFQRRVDDCVRECDTELYTAPDDDFEIK